MEANEMIYFLFGYFVGIVFGVWLSVKLRIGKKSKKKADLSKVDILKLNKAYQKHVVAASKYKGEINKRLSSVPTKSDGGVGNYQQAIKHRKPHIATRKVEPDRSANIEADRSAKIPVQKCGSGVYGKYTTDK